MSNAGELVPCMVKNKKGDWVHEELPPRTEFGKTYDVTRYRPRSEGLFSRIEQWVDAVNGDTHWHVISKDNITSIYGESEDARIADPAHKKTHVYQWLIERVYDDRGNQIVYQYQADQANWHIRRIKYGNFVSTTEALSDDWHFEIGFEYSASAERENLPGETDTASDVGSPRPDPFSSFKSGFEIRTSVRCTQISMFHRFEEVAGGQLFPVSATEFVYENASSMSFLQAVRHIGYREEAIRAMPPLSFSWTKCRLSGIGGDPVGTPAFKPLTMDTDRRITGLFEKGAYQMVDLYGEGLPGVLCTDADSVLYSRPTGDGGYAAGAAPHTFPIERNLQSGEHALMDLSGDGALDLVVTSQSRAGYYASSRDGNWQPYNSFAAIPGELFHSQRQMVDVTGDGLADLLLFEEDQVKLYPSKGRLGYGVLQTGTVQSRLPVTSHPGASEAVRFADMFGDGGQHLVRIRNGSVTCWPSLGYGRFGAKVEIANAPCFGSEMDASRLFITDIDGSGTADLVYARHMHVDIYRNESGNRFSDPISIALPRSWHELSQISFADVLGNGTACLVFTSVNDDLSLDHQYCDFTAGIKPHMLTGIDNNMGASTIIRYSPSTRFYLADKKAGAPWLTRLPFPVQVVDRIETIDHIGGSRLVADYRYHHGYFDPLEREFRGFGRVDRTDAESFEHGSAGAVDVNSPLHVPPVLTKTWYHTGASEVGGSLSQQYAAEYYTGDDAADLLPDTMFDPEFCNETPEHITAACRALHGQVLREEIYGLDHKLDPALNPPDLDAHPYTVTESNFHVRLIQPKASQKDAVCFVHPSETVSWHYERNPADPRISHAQTLEVDDFGNVLKESAISYGRRKDAPEEVFLPADHEKQRLVHMTCTENAFTHAIVDQADVYRAPLPAESCTYELRKAQQETCASGATVLYRVDEIVSFFTQAADGSHDIDYEDLHFDKAKWAAENDGDEGQNYFRRLIEHVRTLYRKDDLTALLPLAMVESMALPGESYKLAFSPGLLEHIFMNKQGGLPGDASFLVGKGGAQGGYISMDGKGWIPSRRIFFDADADIDEPANTAVHELDIARRHFFLPRKLVDPFDQCSQMDYDAYDLLITHSRDAVGNTVTFDNDYRVLEPRCVIDANGNRTVVAFDALGMVVATAVMGKEDEPVGDLLEGFDADPALADLQAFIADPHSQATSLLGKASTRFIYDLERYQRASQSPFSATLARETHLSDPGGDQTKIQISFSYSDGFGREIQKKVQAEAGDAPQRQVDVPLPTGDIRPGDLVRQTQDKPLHTSQRWVGTGRTVFNNKGKPVRQYEPFFSATYLFESEREMTDTGVSPLLFYDPVGRVVATLHPNHSFEKTVFDPWRQESWDVNDTVMQADPSTDPDVGHYLQCLPAAEYLPGWYEQRSNGQQGADEQDAANKAATHAATPSVIHFDTLGRPMLTIVDNGKDGKGEEQKYATRVVRDIEGNDRELIDANDRVAMRYDYDMLGNRIYEASMDAGERWMLHDVTGKPLYAWDSRSHTFRSEYDPLRRPLRSFVTDTDSAGSGKELLTERLVYGEQHPEAGRLNLRGKLYLQLDQAGVVASEEHDFKGNLLRASRRIASEYRQTLDWSAVDAVIPAKAEITFATAVLEDALAPMLETEIYSSSTRYDALNRAVQIIAPHSNKPKAAVNVIQHVYNQASLLERVDVWLDHAGEPSNLAEMQVPSTEKLGVEQIDYNAKGQRLGIAYKNGTSTRYGYDPQTFRLTHLYSRRGEPFNTDCENPSPVLTAAPDVPPEGTPCGLQNLHYSYDPMGNVTHIRDDAQQTIFFDNKRVEPSADYTYDALYRLIKATGREHIGQREQPETSWNDACRTHLAHPGDGQTMRQYEESYQYDPAGNIREVTHSAANGNWTRSYDYNEADNRLVSSRVGQRTAEHYDYDPHGNLLQMPHLAAMQWDYNDHLRMTRRQGAGVKIVSAPQPDEIAELAGNMNQELGIAPDIDQDDGFREDGELTDAHQVQSGEQTWYVYDASGQRIRQVTESCAGTGNSPVRRKERLYLDGFEIYRAYKNDGETAELERETLHIMDDEQRIALVETRTRGRDKTPKQFIRYQFGNHLGSSTLELDEQARIISYEEYTPFGTTSYQAVCSQTESPKRYRYSGKERDDSTGLYYYGARYYAPWLGRWLSPDPAGTAGGINLYMFVSGNPIRFIDAVGFEPITPSENNLQRPARPGTAHMAVKMADSSFPRLVNFAQAARPQVLGGPSTESRQRAKAIYPAIREFHTKVKDELPGYSAAMSTSEKAHTAAVGFSAASAGAAASGYAAPAAIPLGIAAGVAEVGSGTAKLVAAHELNQRPASPTQRGTHLANLHIEAGGRQIATGTAGMTGVPGAGLVAGLAYEKVSSSARQKAEMGLVHGVQKNMFPQIGPADQEAESASVRFSPAPPAGPVQGSRWVATPPPAPPKKKSGLPHLPALSSAMNPFHNANSRSVNGRRR